MTSRSQNREHPEVRLVQESNRRYMPWFTMIRHQNALAMFLASALMRGIHPPERHHFEYFLGVNVWHKQTA
jgi:hypothetical protein